MEVKPFNISCKGLRVWRIKRSTWIISYQHQLEQFYNKSTGDTIIKGDSYITDKLDMAFQMQSLHRTCSTGHSLSAGNSQCFCIVQERVSFQTRESMQHGRPNPVWALLFPSPWFPGLPHLEVTEVKKKKTGTRHLEDQGRRELWKNCTSKPVQIHHTRTKNSQRIFHWSPSSNGYTWVYMNSFLDNLTFIVILDHLDQKRKGKATTRNQEVLQTDLWSVVPLCVGTIFEISVTCPCGGHRGHNPRNLRKRSDRLCAWMLKESPVLSASAWD